MITLRLTATGLPLSMRETILSDFFCSRPEGIFVNRLAHAEIGPDLFAAAWRWDERGWCRSAEIGAIRKARRGR